MKGGRAWVEPHRGAFSVRILEGVGARRKKKRIASYPDRDKAVAHAAKWNAALERGRISPASSETLASMAAEYFDERELNGSRHRTKVRDVKSERSVFRRHIEPSELARIALEKITPVHVDAFVRWLRGRESVKAITTGGDVDPQTKRRPTGRTISRQTQKHALRIVRGMLDEARRQGLLARGAANPASGMTVAPNEQGARDVSDDWLRAGELDVVLSCESIEPVNRRAYACAVGLALRLNDLKAIELAHVHLETQVPGPHVDVRIKKTGKLHHVPVMPWLVPHLEAQIDHARAVAKKNETRARWLFPTRDALRYAKQHDFGWAQKLDKMRKGGRVPSALERAGVARKIRFHDLRGTCATHLALGTWGRRWSLFEIQSMLAHSDQRVTERYVKRAISALSIAASETLSGPSALPAGGTLGGTAGAKRLRTLGDSNPRPTAPEAPAPGSDPAALHAEGGTLGGTAGALGASAELERLRAELADAHAKIAELHARRADELVDVVVDGPRATRH